MTTLLLLLLLSLTFCNLDDNWSSSFCRSSTLASVSSQCFCSCFGVAPSCQFKNTFHILVCGNSQSSKKMTIDFFYKANLYDMNDLWPLWPPYVFGSLLLVSTFAHLATETSKVLGSNQSKSMFCFYTISDFLCITRICMIPESPTLKSSLLLDQQCSVWYCLGI